MKLKFKMLLMSIAFFGIALGANAQQGWTKIGERKVDFKADKDVIHAISKGKFRYLQVHVEDKAVEFDRMQVNFFNGKSQTIALRNRIPAGGKSRILNLKGDLRTITTIEFWYKSEKRGGKKASVIVYGKR